MGAVPTGTDGTTRHEKAALAGRMIGGARAFGYTEDGLTLAPDEAAVIRQLYDRLFVGETVTALTAWLSEIGARTPRGHRWNADTVRELLVNPRNAALRGVRALDGNGRREFWHHVVADAVWPGIVSAEEWELACSLIKRDPRDGTSEIAGAGLLTGIARCGRCALDGYTTRMRTGWRAGTRQLRCSAAAHLSRSAEPIEGYVSEIVLSWLDREDAPVLPAYPPGDHPLVLDAKRNTLRARLDGFARDYANGVLGQRQLTVANRYAAAELTRLDRLADAALAGNPDGVTPEQAWAGAPPSTRRAVVRALLDVTVLPGRPGRRPAGEEFDPYSVRVRWKDQPGGSGT